MGVDRAGVTIDVYGTDRLQRYLKRFGDRVTRHILIKAMVFGVQPLKSKMKELCPVSKKRAYYTSHRHYSKGQITTKVVKHRPGELKRSIGILTFRKHPPAVFVGPRRGSGKANDGWYGRLVEYGTRDHVIKPKRAKFLVFQDTNGSTTIAKSVKVKGVKGTRFIQKSFDQTQGQIVSRIEKYIKLRIKKELQLR